MNKIILQFVFVMLLLEFVYPLQMLEPVMSDIRTGGEIEVGVLAPGEYFLLSFFLEEKDKYDVITTDGYGSNYITFDNIQKTGESIFTVARITENASGNQKIKIILRNNETGLEDYIYLNADIESNVISTFVLPYEKNTEFGKVKNIKIKLLNKSITTKKIVVSSDLPDVWFDTKNGKLEKIKTIYLQPAGSTEVTYSFVPKAIGEKEITLYIYTIVDETQLSSIRPEILKTTSYERNEENIDIYVVKSMSAVYGSNLYNFPTFGLNSIPVYFFNNIIRIITEK